MNIDERDNLKFGHQLLNEAATPYKLEGKITNKAEVTVLTTPYLYAGTTMIGVDICKSWLNSVLSKDNLGDALQAYNDMVAGTYDIGEYGDNTNVNRKQLKKMYADFKKTIEKKGTNLNKALEKLFKAFTHVFLNDYPPSFMDNYKHRYYTIIACAVLIDGYKQITADNLEPYKYKELANQIKTGLHVFINNHGYNDYISAFCNYLCRLSKE